MYDINSSSVPISYLVDECGNINIVTNLFPSIDVQDCHYHVRQSINQIITVTSKYIQCNLSITEMEVLRRGLHLKTEVIREGRREQKRNYVSVKSSRIH